MAGSMSDDEGQQGMELGGGEGVTTDGLALAGLDFVDIVEVQDRELSSGGGGGGGGRSRSGTAEGQPAGRPWAASRPHQPAPSDAQLRRLPLRVVQQGLPQRCVSVG